MPIRILLVGAVVFMAAWFTILGPKDEAIPPSTPAATPAAPGPAQSAPGKFADKAKAGAATAEADATGAANAGIEDGTITPPATTGAPSQTGTAAEPNAVPAPPRLSPRALKGLPEPIQAALLDRRVVVLGVLNMDAKPWASMPDDDRAVRNVLRDVNQYGSDVVVQTVPLAQLSTYEGLVEALQITQSPTVVVVDRDRRAIALDGFVDRGSVKQAIADARRGSVERRITDPYLRRVNRFCGERDLRYRRFSLPTVRGAEGRSLNRLVALTTQDRRTLRRITAPSKQWRGLRAQHARGLAKNQRAARARRAAFERDRSRTSLRPREVAEIAALGPALDRRFNAVGLTSCAQNRKR
jgi:hypothetical protein